MQILGRHRRLAVVLALGSLLVLAALSYIELVLRRPIGEGPAGPRIEAHSFATPWTARHVHVVGLGDSITAGMGARHPGRSFFQRLLQTPPDDFAEMQAIDLTSVLPNLTAGNLAVSGSTSLQHADHIAQRLNPPTADAFGLVVFTTGGNDLIHSYGQRPPQEGAMYGASLEQAEPWIANFADRLDQMIDAIEARFPAGCEIFLADIYDPTDGVGDAPSVYLPDWPDGLAIHAAYNRAIEGVAAQRPNVFVVPLRQIFLGHGAHCRQFWREHFDASDPHYWYFKNIEDPNDRGHDAVRRVFLRTIVENSSLVPRPPNQQSSAPVPEPR
ncbi:MAG: SGNH/GDSL hydrolase family protein [Pirellulales bacterium]|nr:SGNH/GDSL hydrolase family protein [Pirellulales bacterium]